MKILYLVLGCFLSFSVLLFLAVFVSALKTPFGAFESYFYGLGSTVTHKKFFLFDTQKLPKNRELLAWDLYCNIDMELVTGLEPATCSLRMSCTTNCATQAYLFRYSDIFTHTFSVFRKRPLHKSKHCIMHN